MTALLYKFRREFLVYTVSFLSFIYIFYPAIRLVVSGWQQDEYSYGYASPIIALLIVFYELSVYKPKLTNSWWGAGFVVLALALVIIGAYAANIVFEYATLVALFGVVWGLFGRSVAWRAKYGFVYLFLAIPLPLFSYVNFSNWAQLISSAMGTQLLDWFGISVFREGNIIDLGDMKLQVAEACSGLRYIFPFLSFGFIVAWLFDGPIWKRLLLLVSTTPIAILMNSLRIAVIGVTVGWWGIAAAEGVVHSMEGWTVFIVCCALLCAEGYVLKCIGRAGAFNLDKVALPKPPFAQGNVQMSAPVYVILGLLAVFAVDRFSLGAGFGGTEIIPARETFASFPLQIGDWTGRSGNISAQEFAILRPQDYFVADYSDHTEANIVNFYVAYFSSQRRGEWSHSPETCIPGGGWAITDNHVLTLPDFQNNGRILSVNRMVIEKGDVKQLVYYWFQQRGRLDTNEYLSKLAVAYDGLTRHRTDGGLVRLVTRIEPGQTLDSGDQRLQQFLKEVWPRLPDFVPN